MVAVAAVTGVAALALAGWGLAPRTDAEGRSLGPRMAISLVAPREPEITEGEVLEVGTLSDGFDRAALERAAEPVEDPTWMPPDAYAGPDAALPRMPTPRPVAFEDRSPLPEPPPEPRQPLRDGSRWFGLDRMRADAAAERDERRQRRAEQEALERRMWAERRDRDDGPTWGPRLDPRDRYVDRDARDAQDRALADRDRFDAQEAPIPSGPVPYEAYREDGAPE